MATTTSKAPQSDGDPARMALLVPWTLAAIGRHGPILLIAAIVSSVFLPGLSSLAAEHVRAAAFLLTLGSCMAAALSPPEDLKERGSLVVAIVFAGALVPLMVLGLLQLADFEPVIGLAILVAALSPPAGSSAAIATILGLRPRLALIVSLSLTFAAPLTMPSALAAIGIGFAMDFSQIMIRLLAIVGASVLLTWLAIRCRQWSRCVVPDAKSASGIAVAGMLIVGMAVSNGIGTLMPDPARLARLLLLSLALNLAVPILAIALFAAFGVRVALTIGLLGGNRNVTLAWAAAGASLPEEARAYLALCLIPILSQPLLLQLVFAIAGAVERRRTRARRNRQAAPAFSTARTRLSGGSAGRGMSSAVWIAIFLGLPLACEAGAQVAGISLPGAVAGFFALLIVLAWRGAPSHEVSELAQGLVRWLPVVVVAPMVGIFAGSTVRAEEWLAIACGVAAGIVVSQVVTGLVMCRMLARHDRVDAGPTNTAATPAAVEQSGAHATARRATDAAAQLHKSRPWRVITARSA